MKIALVIEYDGKAFCGWQSQAGDIPTVQDELERALSVYLRALSKNSEKDFKPRITASGRTDSGVHAKAQVASFVWPQELELKSSELLHSLNGITQPEICIRSLHQTDDSFDARRTPHRKRYCYRILHGGARPALLEGRCWWIPQTLDFRKMLPAVQAIKGMHDFSAFRASDCSAETTVRTVVKSELEARGDRELLFIVEGKGFLKHMVRILAGTIVEIGQNKRPTDSIKTLFKSLKREEAGMTAPSHALCLEHVEYDLN